MNLAIYKGTIPAEQTSGEQVGVEDLSRNGETVLCICGKAGDEESEQLARRIKAMFEFCEAFGTEALEKANTLRADWRNKHQPKESHHAPV